MININENTWNSNPFLHPDRLKNLRTGTSAPILPKDIVGEWRAEYEGMPVQTGVYYIPGTGIYHVYYDGNKLHTNGVSQDYYITYSRS